MKKERNNSSKTNSLSSYLDNSMDSFKSDVNEIPNYEPYDYSKFKFWKTETEQLQLFNDKIEQEFNPYKIEDLTIEALKQAFKDKMTLLSVLQSIKYMNKPELYSLFELLKNDVIRLIRITEAEFDQGGAPDVERKEQRKIFETAKHIFSALKFNEEEVDKAEQWGVNNLLAVLSAVISLRISDLDSFICELEFSDNFVNLEFDGHSEYSFSDNQLSKLKESISEELEKVTIPPAEPQNLISTAGTQLDVITPSILPGGFFKVVLLAGGPSKLAVVKQVKELMGYGLKEAKDLVDNAPCVLKEYVSECEARAIMKDLLKAGTLVRVEHQLSISPNQLN
jgi:ribosomal protein L7/L12